MYICIYHNTCLFSDLTCYQGIDIAFFCIDMSYVSLERGISYTCRIFLRATGAHFSKATSKWQEHQPILVKTTIFISKWPQATSNSKIWGAEILRSLYFYRYGISIYMCEICAVVYMYIHSICKLETCQKQNYFIFWYYNQKLITSIVCWSANKKRLSWHRHKNAFFSLKKKIINLGMISARHTTNRQSFKKMTFPFKTYDCDYQNVIPPVTVKSAEVGHMLALYPQAACHGSVHTTWWVGYQ